MLLVVLAAPVVLYSLFKYVRYIRSKQPLVIRAPGLPIIGNLLDVMPETCMITLSRYPKLFGSFVELYIFSTKVFLISDVDAVKEVLSKRPKKLRRAELFEYASNSLKLSEGLFTAEGHMWQKIRKATAPSFSPLNISKKFVDIGNETLQWIERLQSKLNGNKVGSFDMKTEAFSYTIRVITKVAFGLDTNDPVAAYFYTPGLLRDVTNLFRYMNETVLFPLPLWLFQYTPYRRTEIIALEGSDRISEACQRVINHKRQLRRENVNYDVKSMIDSILSNTADNALTDQEIIANAKTLYIAGSDTTSVVITWIAYHLALHPEYQERVREEAIEKLFLNKDPKKAIEKLEMATLQQMPICQAVLKETLRLSSPASFLAFDVVTDDPLVLSNGIVINRGDAIWTSLDALMTNGEVFDNPLTWDPERWSNSSAEKLQKMEECYIPFGHGARVCPGMVLAQQEALLAAIMLSYHFKLSLDCPKEEIARVMNFVSTCNKMPIQLESRF